jgi:hypothetical protein
MSQENCDSLFFPVSCVVRTIVYPLDFHMLCEPVNHVVRIPSEMDPSASDCETRLGLDSEFGYPVGRRGKMHRRKGGNTPESVEGRNTRGDRLKSNNPYRFFRGTYLK